MDRAVALTLISVLVTGLSHAFKDGTFPRGFRMPDSWRAVILSVLGVTSGAIDMIANGADFQKALMTVLATSGGGLVVLILEALGGGGSGPAASGGGVTSLPRPSKAPTFGGGAAMVGLAVMLALIPGCAFLRGVSPALVQAQTEVEEAESVLQTIRSVVEIFFAEVPNPALKSKVEQGLADAELARDAILRAIDAAKSADAGDVDAAYAKFNSAYADLYQILIDAGVVTPSGGKIGVARGHAGVHIDIPTPLTMGHARS